MRRKKHKATRRACNYYRINYGFHEPYKVLLDGNFIHATKAINLSELDTHLPKLLGGTCKLYTTKCVTRELRSLGPQFTAAAAAARAFPLHKCDHGDCKAAAEGGQKKKKKQNKKKEKEEANQEEEGDDEDEEGEEEEQGGGGGGGEGPISAADCIRAVIGRRNEQHWFVATQDAALRKELGQIPGCPLVFATVNGIHLETPSEVTRQKAKEAEAATRSLSKHERAAEPLLREERLAALRKEMQRGGAAGAGAAAGGGGGAAGGGAGGGGGLPPTMTSARFRRNKAKGPNPLAFKKKARKSTQQQQQQQQSQKRKAEGEPSAGAGSGGGGGGNGGSGGDGAAAAGTSEQQQAAKRRRKRAKQAAAGGGGGGGDE
ncbi:hypothetical protein PLESTB_001670800 [Pleodorina starrii]|uniref:UTP23 sensor motif region domain-containing protein n=1 Tax=Pleodorina starrii TaxID=330485 RepID=A0A9W6BZN8_9CHLO|nr:hypothetical protein PLESTM_000623800 [Pleodorina starrii]GLC60787.1 hypothetical protein PLESTB_001670800 [Pleodorina starrii]GLC75507.1 hypothetical protein PLESTF_001645200 [Pleodorina starrii]